MSAVFTRPASTGRGTLVGFGLAALVVLGLAVVALRGGDGRPLDPDGTGPLGAKAGILLLRELGADVRVSAATPAADVDVAYLLQDTLDAPRTEALQRWVEAGHTLVVADPGSSLNAAQVHLSPINGGGSSSLKTGCSLRPLRDVRDIELPAALTFEDPTATGAVACFRTDDGPFLVATPIGAGTVVALGGAGVFVNRSLGKADNAALVAGLLAPAAGTRVQYVTDLAPDADLTAGASAGGRSITSVLPRGWRWALVELVVAFGVLALWRARRLGRPVLEDQPVELPGSELVVAVGHLYQRGARRQQAAAALVNRARSTVSDRLGLPAHTAPEVVAQVAAARTGLPVEQVMMAIAPPVPTDDEALVVLAQNVEAVLLEVARAR